MGVKGWGKEENSIWAVSNPMSIGCGSGRDAYGPVTPKRLTFRSTPGAALRRQALRGTCCHPAARELYIFNQQKVNNHLFGMTRVVQMLQWGFYLFARPPN